MGRTPETARRLFDRFEPVHAVTYFFPEAREACDGLGLRGFWMGYFAARSAPLGAVPAEVVTAAFYNFSHEHVARALPAAWSHTSTEAALRARTVGAVAALRRSGVTADEDTVTAAALLEKAALGAPTEGRPLFAANRALPLPDEPLERLWHAATLLREQRGDGHVALLVGAGIGGRESNVLHSAADRVPQEAIRAIRRYDDDEWHACTERLVARGIVDRAGGLTAAGRELKDGLETATDRLALEAFDALDDAELDLLFRTLTPIARKVVATGDIPAGTPMGLDRDDLENDGARL